jgi:hypothetical protein
LASGAALSAQTAVNLLTNNATVRANGTYTYYARGNSAIGGNVTAFTEAFYPGSPHVLNYATPDSRLYDKNASGYLKETAPEGGTLSLATHNGVPIGIANGKLADGETRATSNNFGANIGYWVGVTDCPDGTTGGTAKSITGAFDILFDLGAQYYITRIEIVYGDTTSNRWATNADQTVYTAATLADSTQAAEQDFSIFGSARIATTNTNEAALSITGTSPEAVLARYIDLRLAMSVALNYSGNTAASEGGYIQEIRIHGYAPVPEPAATAALAGTAALIACGLIRHLKNR